jgi:hypothetical protein
MAKFSFRRPRIISKKFPRVDSSIDSVTKSLNELVFSYSEQVDKSLQKKHVMMAISSLVLILVLGSFISPKGKAESSIFYPDTCLGGWVNPQYAQGEQQTTSNGDETQFNKNNSAVLPKNTNAEMYCGNFKGKFDQATKPTKIIVSLALTKGDDLLLEDRIESSSFSSSSLEILDAASSTDVSFTLASSTASSTLLQASSTDKNASTTVDEGTTTTEVTQGTTTVVSTSTDTSTGTPSVVTATPHSQDTAPSVVTGIIESFKDTVNTLFSSSVDTSAKTDTVVVPPPAPAPVPEVTPAPEPAPAPAPAAEAAPTSWLPTLKSSLISALFQRVFAQTADSTTTDVIDPKPVDLVTAASTSELVDGSSTLSTSTLEIVNNMSSSTLVGATTTDPSLASSTDDNQFQNNFLEVLYTFDGVTWTSLGELNEISMKYRTFEIPVTASTTWSDMSHLQVKVVAQKHVDETPTVYLDAIKVEVLYETIMTHEHPDFARDTILKDEVVDGMRVLTIINNETKAQEVWYMHIDTTASTTVAEVTTSSTTDASSTLVLTSSTTESTSTASQHMVIQDASSTGTSTTVIPIPVIDPLLNKWKKYDGKDTTIATKTIVEEIKKQEATALIDAQAVADTLPNFASDTVKRMKGAFLNMVIVQVQKGTSTDELWLYNATDGTQEKLGATASSAPMTSITVAPDTPLGLKDNYVFWLSLDKSTVYAYNLETKSIVEQPLPAYDATRGERAEMTFDTIPWKVIMGNDGFSFYSVATGEVFSDEDSRIVEALRQKMGLDAVLNKETLSNLSLPVSADPVTVTPAQ